MESNKSQLIDQLRILGQFCLVIAFCTSQELQKRVLKIILGFVLMDYASCLKFLKSDRDVLCEILMARSVSQVLNILRLILMFCFVLMVLQSCWHSGGFLQVLSDLGRKTSDFRNGVCSKIGLGEAIYSICCNCGPGKFLCFSKKDHLLFTEDEKTMSTKTTREEDHHDVIEHYDEDEEINVLKLRKMVKVERHKANKAFTELDKERMAAASATEEAMAMILRLQSEMSSLNIQANQYKRLAEQKLLYKQDIIRSLYHMVIKQYDQLRLFRQKLKECCEEDYGLNHLEEIEENLRLLESAMEEDFRLQ